MEVHKFHWGLIFVSLQYRKGQYTIYLRHRFRNKPDLGPLDVDDCDMLVTLLTMVQRTYREFDSKRNNAGYLDWETRRFKWNRVIVQLHSNRSSHIIEIRRTYSKDRILRSLNATEFDMVVSLLKITQMKYRKMMAQREIANEDHQNPEG